MPAVAAFHPVSALGGYTDPVNTTRDHYGFDFFARPEPAAFAVLPSRFGARASDFPVASAGRERQAFMATTYFDDYYNRIHVTPAAIDAGNVTADQRFDITVWNAFFEPREFSGADGLEEGVSGNFARPLPWTMPALAEEIWQLALSPAGPAEIDLSLVFSFAGEPDAAVVVTGNRVVIFSWTPNWASAVIERRAWLTDILESTSGMAQRRALRASPRCFLSAEFLARDADRAFLDLALSAWASRVWALPYWPDGKWLTTDIPAGETFIPTPTSDRDYAAGRLALIIGASAFDAEGAEIADVLPDGLVLSRPLSKNWEAGARVFPAWQARLVNPPETRRKTDRAATFEAEFARVDYPEMTGISPTVTYRGLPVFLERPDETEDLARGQERLLKIIDNEVGLTQVTDTANRAFHTVEHRFVIDGRERLSAFLGLAAACRGRQKPLWASTHACDLTMTSPAAGTGMTIARAGVARFGVDTPGRRDLWIQMKDGTNRFCRVVAAMEEGEIERLAVEPPFAAAILPEAVARVSFLVCCRLDSDEIEIEHLGDNGGVARATLVFRGVAEPEP
jgi:hypothetical protein